MAGTRQRDYSRGKIYKLECLTTGKIYIGSTTKEYLSQRLTKHVHDFKSWQKGKYGKTSSFEIIEGGNYEISLLEACPCNTKDELLARERHWIKSMECVNKCIPVRPKGEHYEENKEKILERCKQYYQENAERIRERNKKWHQENAEKMAEYDKSYRQKNKDRIREYQANWYQVNADRISARNKERRDDITAREKQYRESNAEMIKHRAKKYRERHADRIAEYNKQYRNEKIECPCGSTISRPHVHRHEKTKKHQQWQESQNES